MMVNINFINISITKLCCFFMTVTFSFLKIIIVMYDLCTVMYDLCTVTFNK